MRTITLETLLANGADKDCSSVEAFRKLFGKKRSFRSEAACVKVALEHATQFDWDWAATNLLSDTAWVKYRKATAPAWAEYNKATADALAKYDKATAAAFARLWFNDKEAG